MRKFDLVVVGCGQGGDPLARAYAEAGKSVAILERGPLGGSCVNWGCTPTKTLAAAARVAHMARRAPEFGVRTGEIAIDYPTIHARKDRIVHEFRDGLEQKLAETEGIEVIRGEARFTGPRQLAINDEEIEGEVVVIDTGSRPQIPDVPGLKDVPYLTAAELLDLEELPEHLIILGGGYIGLEFGQSFRRFGARVTIVEKGDRLLTREDADVTEAIETFLRKEGIAIECHANVSHVASEGEEIVVTLEGKSVRGTHLLVATSQSPNTEVLDLEKAGVEKDERGFVRVDEHLRTSAEGVYAIGDVKGGPAFTHISYDDFRVVRASLLRNGDRTTKGRMAPYCVYTDPQLGRVGLSESEAKEKGISYRIGRLEMSDLGLPNERGETTGFIKVLVGDDGLILGVACLGIDCGEHMALFQMAMMGGLKADVLCDGIYAHPTLAESFNLVFADLKHPE